MFLRDYKLSDKGFTLIETFVAISILLIAVMGPLRMFSQAIADGLYAKNQIISYYLAQEGVELAAFYRRAKEDLFFDRIIGCSETDPCRIYLGVTGDVEIETIGDGDGFLSFDDIDGYGHKPDESKTIFWRKIYIEYKGEVFPNEDYMNDTGVSHFGHYILSSVVGWSHFGLHREFTISREFIRMVMSE